VGAADVLPSPKFQVYTAGPEVLGVDELMKLTGKPGQRVVSMAENETEGRG